MGLLDGASPLDMYAGILSPDALQSIKQQRAMQGLYAMGAAYGANSGASRLPITTGQVLGAGAGALANSNAQFDQTIPQQATAPYQVQNAQIQNAQLMQHYKLMQDAINGTGAFAGGQGQPSAQPPVPPQAGGQGQPPAPSSPGGPLSPQAAGQTALAGGGGPSMANAGVMNGLLSGNGTSMPPPATPPMPQQAPAQTGAMGGAPDLYRKALISEALVPGSGKSIIDKNTMGYENVREGGVIYGPNGKIIAQNPKIPPNMALQANPDGSYTAIPVQGATAGAATNEAIKQDAAEKKEKDVARFNYGLSTGEAAPDAGAGALAHPGTIGTPPASTGPPAPSALVSRRPNGDINTNRGTVVPFAFSNQKMGPGSDLINKQNTESINTEKGWAVARPAIETQGARLQVISNAFSNLDTKGFTQARADAANALNGVGLKVIGDQIMSQANVADVQRVLWAGMQDVMSQLKAANAGTGGRILRAEFEAYMDHAFSPDQVGPALRTAVTQQLGTLYQQRNMIDDYYGVGRQNNWRDANQFQNAYLQKNPIDGFVNYAEKTVPQFKGGDETPNMPKSLSSMQGLQYSPSRKQFKDASGKIYDSLGNEVK